MARNKLGQASIEFALTLLLLFSFVLFFYQLAHIFAVGNYVQYATFMSARALESGGKNANEQSDRAQKTLSGMLTKNGKDRFGYAIQGVGGGNLAGATIGAGPQFVATNRSYSWMEGVRYAFRGKLFLMQLFGREATKGSGVELTSESWLGRETSYDECVESLSQMGGLSDNGC